MQDARYIIDDSSENYEDFARLLHHGNKMYHFCDTLKLFNKWDRAPFPLAFGIHYAAVALK